MFIREVEREGVCGYMSGMCEKHMQHIENKDWLKGIHDKNRSNSLASGERHRSEVISSQIPGSELVLKQFYRDDRDQETQFKARHLTLEHSGKQKHDFYRDCRQSFSDTLVLHVFVFHFKKTLGCFLWTLKLQEERGGKQQHWEAKSMWTLWSF